MVIMVFTLVWTPYLSSLNNKIWKTKGMLNMIPMEIIINNPKLSEKMNSEAIMKAVR